MVVASTKLPDIFLDDMQVNLLPDIGDVDFLNSVAFGMQAWMNILLFWRRSKV
jgi:hypothetical protein